jgi:hypothetical protein
MDPRVKPAGDASLRGRNLVASSKSNTSLLDIDWRDRLRNDGNYRCWSGVGWTPSYHWSDTVQFLERLLLHYGIYRRYPLKPWPAFKNAWRIAFR